MGVNPNVLRIQLKQNLNCSWTRATDLGFDRISSIDLRQKNDPSNGNADIKLCVIVTDGVFVQREGYLNKLIPWSNIDDLDIEGEAPGFVAQDFGTQGATGASAPSTGSVAAKAANPAMPVKK